VKTFFGWCFKFDHINDTSYILCQISFICCRNLDTGKEIIIYKLILYSSGSFARAKEKREPGENPGRSGHCKWELPARYATGEYPGRQQVKR
jgi:hypothetical protein